MDDYLTAHEEDASDIENVKNFKSCQIEQQRKELEKQIEAKNFAVVYRKQLLELEQEEKNLLEE